MTKDEAERYISGLTYEERLRLNELLKHIESRKVLTRALILEELEGRCESCP